MNKPKRWNKEQRIKLITLGLPARITDLDNFLTKVAELGSVDIQFDIENNWLYAEFEMGSTMSGGEVIE